MKEENYVRLTAIEIQNIKNIDNGRVSFPIEEEVEKNGLNNAFGIYGPNGSGKTSLISSLSVLKQLLVGASLNNQSFAKLINVNSDTAKLAYEFICFDQKNDFKFRYEIELLKLKVIDPADPLNKSKNNVLVKKETLYCLGDNKQDYTKRFFSIDITNPNLQKSIAPANRYDEFLNNKTAANSIMVQKITSNIKATSFIFSKEMLGVFANSEEFGDYFKALHLFVKFGIVDLFVIDQAHNNDIFLNLNYRSKHGQTITQTMGSIVNYRTALAESDYNNYRQSLKAANILLQALVPDLQIVIDDDSVIDTMIGENIKGKSFELISIRNGNKLPLSLESNGIKSIFSVASLLISAYNDKSVTVAIDEYDSGVFEYLLGDILDVYKVNGKGLFIFTSHNLRPLEILGKKRIYFTINKKNDRFSLYSSYVQPGTNFRNQYMRSLFLGSEEEPFAFKVRKSDIRKAFMEANKVYNE